MIQLPGSFLDSLKSVKGFDRDAFEKVHASGKQITTIRFNSIKWSLDEIKNHSTFAIQSKIPWTDYGFYLSSRPSFTFDPIFHAGCYYVQEASSMLLEQALKQTVDLTKSLKVLDLCAAPGGKSTHIHSLISKESLLVSNEVIRSRANVLKENVIKWGCENVVVTNNDPKDFSKLEEYFDVIVIDAPCSGSGLFRKDTDTIKEWNENNVQLCSQRQQRIIADVWNSLKKDGILIYSTCSYSKEEDEEILKWISENFPVENKLLKTDDGWGIIESEGGYRCWPDKVSGEGFFLACFQKMDGGNEKSIRAKNKPEYLNKNQLKIIERWVKPGDRLYIKHRNTVYAWPEIHNDDFSFLLEKLHVIYSGILIGELMRDKLVPDHALAMSNIFSELIYLHELDIEDSRRYLQRKEIKSVIDKKGWSLIIHQNHPLGWVNVLQSRINNYYPKELRILKDL